MYIETWHNFIDLIDNMLPGLRPSQKLTWTSIRRYAYDHKGKYKGIPQFELDTITEQIEILRDISTGEVKADLIRAWWFIRSINRVVVAKNLKTWQGCLAHKYYWYDNACHVEEKEAPPPKELPPEHYHTPSTCKAAGFYWWNAACHARWITLEDVRTQEACVTWGGYWYGNACHTTPAVEIPPILTGIGAMAEQVAAYCETIPVTKIIEKGVCITIRNWLRVIAGFQAWLAGKS